MEEKEGMSQLFKNIIAIMVCLSVIFLFECATIAYTRVRAEDSKNQTNTDIKDETPKEVVAVTYTYLDGEEEKQVSHPYMTLEEAVLGVTEARAELATLGQGEVIPCIQVLESFAVDKPVLMGSEEEDSLDLTIDFQGKYITLTANEEEETKGFLDFQNLNVTFIDSSISETEESEEMVPGGIRGDGDYLITGAGNLLFQQGLYLNPTGTIVDKAAQITVEGGFFSFDEEKGFVPEMEVILPQDPVKMCFATASVSIEEEEFLGYELGEVQFITTLGEDTAYYANFGDAFEGACKKSQAAEEAPVTVSLFNENIKKINLGQSYALQTDTDLRKAKVILSQMNFARSKDYDGNLFTVYAGELTFENCSIDGFISEDSLSVGSAIRVLGEASLRLNNTEITGNRSVHSEEDPGAAICLKSGAFLYLNGKVSVKNNTYYVAASGDNFEQYLPQNIYMEKDAKVIIVDELTAGEASIGITQNDELLAGYTPMGSFSEELYQRIKATEERGFMDATLAAFSLDGKSSYFLAVNLDNNQIFWDRFTRLLPEAGIFRLEYLLIVVALILFIICNVNWMREHRGLYYTAIVFMIIFLASGIGLGFLHIYQEKMVAQENMRVLKEMSLAQEQQVSFVEKKTSTVEMKESKEETPAVRVPEDGRVYYGVISIPSMDMSLPILANYTEADMKTTPCVYFGQARDNNLVVVGHNYNTQFGELVDCKAGTKVQLTMMDGSKRNYKVDTLEYLNPEQVDEMLTGDWDLTLFTCSYSGDKRIAVRCKAID